MTAPPSLTRKEIMRGLAASRGDVDELRAWAEDFDPEVFEAWQGWVWGRHKFDLQIGTPDPILPEVSVISTLEAIEYIARKQDADKIARRAVYRHKHDRPFAHIATAPYAAPDDHTLVNSRGKGPRQKHRALFVLGELHGLEGVTPNGERRYWPLPRDRASWRGLLLVGDPTTHDMQIIRTGAARRSAPPIWILRGKSPYRLTDRGIER